MTTGTITIRDKDYKFTRETPMARRMTLYTKCPICKKQHSTFLDDSESYKLNTMQNVQQALLNATASRREFFISGICDTCWDELFDE